MSHTELYMLHNRETLIFVNFQILRFYLMQNKEIVIFHVHSESQFYILHGAQCRNLDICKFQDFVLFKVWKF